MFVDGRFGSRAGEIGAFVDGIFVRFERFCAFVRIRKMKVGLCDLKDEGGFER